MIDAQTETLRTMNAARRLPWMKGRTGNDVSLCTLTRWSSRGIRGVVLETIKIGGTTYTTDEATLRFIERLNTEGQSAARPTTRRRRDIAAADARLDAAGI